MSGLSFERLKSILRYEPETGLFWWLEKKRKRVLSKPAGYVNGNGYLSVTIDGGQYYQHRLAWFYMTGEMPDQLVDHVNRDPADNRWSNLRLASKAQNNVNRYAKARWMGVWFNNRTGKWRAQSSGGKRYIGEYDCPAVAHFAYVVESHRRYGAFA